MKKIVSLILVLAIAFSMMAGMGVNVNAATQVETILNRAAYLAANNPHAYDGLCLAFCADCYKAAGYAGVSMGTAYNAGTQWIQSTSSSNIPVGALVFFDLTWHATAGHVGIYAGNGKMYDAESQYGGIKLRNFTTKGYRGWGWYNRIAPTGSSAVDITTPTLSFNKGSYLVGETANITWTASSSQSDLKHYWLVITNTTLGKQYYGASVGTNSYSLKLTEAGSIKVDVYAIKNDGSGLSDSKTFNVSTVDVSTPTLSINKGSYLVGETAKITWTASSSKSDLKHYWLVINNTTNGNKYYGASVGTNSYSLKLTEAGSIKVDVYAIRNDGSGLSDSKTFTVTQTCINHSYSSKVTKSATCTANGIKTFTCSKCGDSYTQTIAALGHDYKDSITKAATCTEKGVKTFKCSRCTSSYKQDIAVLGHDYISKVTDTGYFEIYNGSWECHKPYTFSTTCTRCNYWKTSEKSIPIRSVTLQQKTFVYTGSMITPVVTVKNDDGKTLKKGIDYTVKYESGRKQVGTYCVKVYFNNEYYEGTATLLFKIVPKGTALSKLIAGKKCFAAQWSRHGGITGYQIQYSTNVKFIGAKLVTIKGATSARKTIKNLKAKQVYYVRVRTYKTVSGTHYMSAWSKTYKVKTK